MKIKTLLLFIALAGLFSVQGISGIGPEDFIEPDLMAILNVGEMPVLVQFKDAVPQLIPRNIVLGALVETVRKDLEPSVMVETLHLYKKPAEAAKGFMSAEEEAGVYNGLLALSTLAGLRYYSASRGTMRTFYETSAIVDGPSSKKILPDPVYFRPPDELTVYAKQKDLTFGDNNYQYSYFTSPGAMIFVQQNLSALTVGIIPAIGRNKLRSVVAVLDAGDYLLIYMVSMAKAATLPGMKERIGNSFTNRAEAVLLWFSDRADRAFGKLYQ